MMARLDRLAHNGHLTSCLVEGKIAFAARDIQKLRRFCRIFMALSFLHRLTTRPVSRLAISTSRTSRDGKWQWSPGHPR